MRRKRNITKLGFTFTILLLALATISYSYAGLTDIIIITGTVTTGEWECDETAWARMNDVSDDTTYDFPGDNWATYIIHQPTENPETFYLYAGQHYRVGELYVSKDVIANTLVVEYSLDAGFSMSETHLHIATTLDGIPQKNGNPIPGQFEYKQDHDPKIDGYTYTIPWDDAWDGINLYIAAHAVVWGGFDDCTPCNCDC